MTRVLAIMLAGGLGAAARYGLTLLIQGWLAGRGSQSALATTLGVLFPLGTLLVNVAGTLLLAFLTTLVLARAVDPHWRWILGTGFLGAFTTWSAFSLDAEAMMARGEWKLAGIYVFGSLLLSLAAVLLGRILAMRLADML